MQMQLFDLPGWAALSAPGIKSLGLPERVRDLVIALDNDENGTGQEAALFSRPEMFQHGAGDAG